MRKNHDGDEEVARQLERDVDDDEMWEQEAVKIERRPSRTSVLSLRLPTAEFHALLRAARQEGESVSEYVRKAIAARMATPAPSTFVSAAYSDVAAASGGASLRWLTLTSGSVQSAREEAISSTC
ncbi:MAG TPA: hypothetical protein VFQ25_03480 [Ktedonobacterales bacterium]|nr:hypothetical protein [Ktedonobacterales bacterium]